MAQLGLSMIASSAREWIAFCRAAEALELAGVWTADTFARDCFVDAALALTHTTKLTVGLGVALPTRSPLQTARAAASLGEFGGRFRLGFGVGHSDSEGAASLKFFHMAGAGAMESAHGIPFHPPLKRMRDYLDCVLGLLYGEAGSTVDIERTHFRARSKGFGFSPATLPLMLGAMGPKMCELAGERANGLILHHIVPWKLMDERVSLARAAHARSKQSATPFVAAQGTIASVDPDEGVALRRARAELTGALILAEYRERVAHVNPELAEKLGAMLDKEQYAQAAMAIPEELVREMIVVATPRNFYDVVAAFPHVDVILALPGGIFAPMIGDAMGLGESDWKATREHLLTAIFRNGLGKF